MCVTAIGPDHHEDWEEMSALSQTALRIFADALDLLIGTDILADLLLNEKYSYVWIGCLNPFHKLLDELLFTATKGKEGRFGLVHKSLIADAPRWQLQLARNFFRQVKKPIPANIRDFLRAAKKITASLLKTRSVEITDKETYETLVAFLQIARKYQ